MVAHKYFKFLFSVRVFIYENAVYNGRKKLKVFKEKEMQYLFSIR